MSLFHFYKIIAYLPCFECIGIYELFIFIVYEAIHFYCEKIFCRMIFRKKNVYWILTHFEVIERKTSNLRRARRSNRVKYLFILFSRCPLITGLMQETIFCARVFDCTLLSIWLQNAADWLVLLRVFVRT